MCIRDSTSTTPGPRGWSSYTRRSDGRRCSRRNGPFRRKRRLFWMGWKARDDEMRVDGRRVEEGVRGGQGDGSRGRGMGGARRANQMFTCEFAGRRFALDQQLA
eukprot:6756234-Pyramimonas_sp.AAC.1